jgi:hypothetical protein
MYGVHLHIEERFIPYVIIFFFFRIILFLETPTEFLMSYEKLGGCFKKKQRTPILPVHLVRVANILLVFSVVSFGFHMLFIIFIAVFFDLSLSLDIRVLDIDLTFNSLNLLFLVSYKS